MGPSNASIDASTRVDASVSADSRLHVHKNTDCGKHKGRGTREAAHKSANKGPEKYANQKQKQGRFLVRDEGQRQKWQKPQQAVQPVHRFEPVQQPAQDPRMSQSRAQLYANQAKVLKRSQGRDVEPEREQEQKPEPEPEAQAEAEAEPELEPE